MTYDNSLMKKLRRTLDDKKHTTLLAMTFLDQMKNEMSGNKDPNFVGLFREASEVNVKRQINIVWETAESPIERIFVSSLLMMFLRYRDPLGLVITPAMCDAERNMEELRQSIAELKRAVAIREKQGDDMSPVAMLHDLQGAVSSGKLPASQYDLNLQLIWYYHWFKCESALHLTPQATFPNALRDGRGVRADLMFWVPDFSEFRIVVECDSYQYHDNKKTFDHDRQRSRVLQRRGFKVLQYSGGEICRDPIQTSLDLYKHLTNELDAFVGKKKHDA